MKNFTKLLSVLLVFAMLLSFAACDSKKKNRDDDDDEEKINNDFEGVYEGEIPTAIIWWYFGGNDDFEDEYESVSKYKTTCIFDIKKETISISFKASEKNTKAFAEALSGIIDESVESITEKLTLGYNQIKNSVYTYDGESKLTINNTVFQLETGKRKFTVTNVADNYLSQVYLGVTFKKVKNYENDESSLPDYSQDFSDSTSKYPVMDDSSAPSSDNEWSDTSSEEDYNDTAAYSQGLSFELLFNGTYAVSGIGSCTDTDVYIPNEYNGKAVTTIGDYAFDGCSSLTSVTIPNSVISIGYFAFGSNYSLKSVTIPDSVTSICYCAFYHCDSLTSITIPNSVILISNSAFCGCDSLESLTVSAENSVYYSQNNCIIERNTNTLVVGCNNSIIPNSVTTIGSSAFDSCTSLTSITIPNSVTSIGDEAFLNCTSLTSITIPNSVTSIGDYAFYNCYSLTSITIPSSVTSIGDCAFYNCYSLTSITIPNSVTSIGVEAFAYCNSLTSVTIPNSVTSIGENAFDNCESLTDIYCDFESKPDGWSDDWNMSNATVHWLESSPDIPSTLVSAGMEYTYPTNAAGTHGARDYTGNLTDGIVPESFEYGDTRWFGLFNNIGAADGSANAILGWGDFVFDFGTTIDLASIWVCNGNDNSFMPPEMTVYLSNDGANWTEAGTLSAGTNNNGVVWYSENFYGYSARYVKISVTCPGATYWSFIGEIEIYAYNS